MESSLLSSQFLTMPAMLESISENSEVQELYSFLVEYVDRFSSEIDFTTVPSSDKLGKLTTSLLLDLARDMKDEISRREAQFPSSLEPREEFPARRNISRQKLCTFSEKRVAEYCADVVFEMEKRSLIKGKYFSSKTKCSDEACESTDALLDASELKLEVIESSVPSFKRTRVEDSPFAPSITRLDSLFAMIDDIGSFFGDDNTIEEVEAVKQKHALEVAELHNTISKYETVIIPEKNREIVKLMSKVEEADMQISRLNREIAKLKEEVSSRDQLISDQKILYSTLNAALEKIHSDLSERANLDGNRARSAMVQELKSSPLFRELKLLNQLISKAVISMEESVNGQNHKAFLKLLRDVGNASKSSLIGFERILQQFSGLEIEDIVSEGDEFKKSFVQALSALLVAGKDYGMTPNKSSSLRSALESFKAKHESVSSFQERLESSIDLL